MDAKMRAELERVWVEKITQSRDFRVIHIYLVSEHLIPKKMIYILEGMIKQQLFPHRQVIVQIEERYRLSAQYTPENLWNAYRDSILLEFLYQGKLLRKVFEEGEIGFAEDAVLVTLPDHAVARNKAEEVRALLRKIFCERCGVAADIRMTFGVTEQRSFEEERDRATALEAARILQESTVGTGEKTPIKEAEKKGKFEKKRGEYKSSYNRKKGSSFGKKKNIHDDVLFGFDFEEEPIAIEEIVGEMGEVVVEGQVISLEERQLKTGTSLFVFNLTDFTDTITVKMFARPERAEKVREFLHPKVFLKIKGTTAIDKFDGELGITSVNGIRKGMDGRVTRVDNAPKKRVELHCHTKMSDMDGVSETSSLLLQAQAWGHPAMAITDHGVVQAFTEANHTKLNGLKIIYGVEGYLVDDLKEIVIRPGERRYDDTCVVFDIETTGLSPYKDKIIEIGAVKMAAGEIVDRFSAFVNPERPIPAEIERLTGISDKMVLDAETIETVLPKFLEFCGDAVIVAHNASFDTSFVREECKRQGCGYEPAIVDTVGLARILLPHLKNHKLNTVADAVGVSLENHHRAVDDAEATAGIFREFIQMLAQRGIMTLADTNRLGTMTPEAMKKLPRYHIVLLAKNDVGRINLYRLVSMSHIQYYFGRPCIPKSQLLAHREGLIIGSACEAGELFRAILDHAPDEEIAKIVEMYDYLEVQPIGNNRFMIEDEKHEAKTEEDLRDYNRRIVELGEKFNKPVVATGDVHFKDPQDEMYRRIIMAGQGFKDADNQAPLYLRTTEEMLAEFDYLGAKKAEELVITNTNLIADMCEPINPVRPDKCPPVIADSDKTLRELCYSTAHEMYGEELPDIVVKRLEKELNSIISNGFAVMYIIAWKLVSKSNEDGYLVGSRGSVGSSLAATMAKITEVNPLPPHYRCDKCHYYDFDSPEVKAFGGGAGCDMPDKCCPICGHKLTKDGYDIPFETFLGFKGNK